MNRIYAVVDEISKSFIICQYKGEDIKYTGGGYKRCQGLYSFEYFRFVDNIEALINLLVHEVVELLIPDSSVRDINLRAGRHGYSGVSVLASSAVIITNSDKIIDMHGQNMFDSIINGEYYLNIRKAQFSYEEDMQSKLLNALSSYVNTGVIGKLPQHYSIPAV